MLLNKFPVIKCPPAARWNQLPFFFGFVYAISSRYLVLAPPLWSCKIISAFSANSHVAVCDTVGERPAGKTRAEQMDASESGTQTLILHPLRRSGKTRCSFHRYTAAFLNADGQRSQVSRGSVGVSHFTRIVGNVGSVFFSQ